MGNLFLREKESWFVWSVWGVFGALFTLYVTINTDKSYFFMACPTGVIVLLTWWLQQSKRFDFARAYKICSYVLLITLSPAFIFIFILNNKLSQFDLMLQSGVLIGVSLLVCLICSLIARRPKQYY